MTQKGIAGGVVHKVPEDLRTMLAGSSRLLELWESFTPLARNEWICWIESGKKAETRIIRLQKMRSKMAAGMRRPCCWAGCPHR
jgi:uncharacterized protein YdeI (YjbR/CyaY-like superfamily)